MRRIFFSGVADFQMVTFVYLPTLYSIEMRSDLEYDRHPSKAEPQLQTLVQFAVADRNCTDMQQVDVDDITGDELVRSEATTAFRPLFDLSQLDLIPCCDPAF